jgi:uncharacterized protein YcbK (DUF882 family)
MDRTGTLHQGLNSEGISRRDFLGIGLMTMLSGVIPSRAFAAVEDFLSFERSLSFYNLHTKEDLHTIYFKDGEYLPDALAEINHIMRDHYNGAVKPIDTDLLDLLYAIRIKTRLNSHEPFHIISGYRTASTNAMLSKKNSTVSMKSLHVKGKAVDIRLPGYELKDLRRTAYELKSGGVGYYPKSNFVHLDVGRVRYW